MGNKNDLVGITKEMKCGIKGTVIWASEDRKKVNIEFENGVIMTDRCYSSFSSKSLNPLSLYINIPTIGFIFKTNQGSMARVLEVINCNKILIEFQDEYRYKKYVPNSEIKSGSILNPYYKSVCGVGYLGVDTKNTTEGNYNRCKNTWMSIIRRGYDKQTKIKRPKYLGCSVCDEWHNFQNFKKWYDENYYEINGERMCIDKDIITKDNKIYSPKACILYQIE